LFLQFSCSSYSKKKDGDYVDVYSFLQKKFHSFVSETLGYGVNDFEIVKIYVEVSSLFEEITLLISHQKKGVFFQQTHTLEEFKYDFPNKCGVLFLLTGDDPLNKTLIKTFGNEQVLFDKNWI
jgi:hypothetical protein